MPHSTRAPQDSFLLCRPRNAGPLAWVLAAVAMVLAAELSRSFPIGDREASLIWPPAGLALGLAIAFGPRLLPLLAAVLYAWAVGWRRAWSGRDRWASSSGPTRWVSAWASG
ncbi:MAG: hypothetical protein ACOC48_02270 [Thiohalospira sp.]